MRVVQLIAFAFLSTVMFCQDASAQCPPWRPCGPGQTWGGNRLVPQGFYGADFRPACANHDACYASCANRRDCDRQFLQNMQSACDCSTHPMLCRHKARCYYINARLFGGLVRQ
jgi:hypothetical protein